MCLFVATTHRPATDLGFLLHKHPDRLHEAEVIFGKAWLIYTQATLILDVDPVGLVRGKGQVEGLMDQYVDDRPHEASSFLSVALNKTLPTAMTGCPRIGRNSPTPIFRWRRP